MVVIPTLLFNIPRGTAGPTQDPGLKSLSPYVTVYLCTDSLISQDTQVPTEKALHSFPLIPDGNLPRQAGFLWVKEADDQLHVRTESVA